jgi:hypothetical protein
MVQKAWATQLSRAKQPPVSGTRGTLIHQVHTDPGKIVTDLVVALALGGDCLADITVLRAQSRSMIWAASSADVSGLAVCGSGVIHSETLDADRPAPDVAVSSAPMAATSGVPRQD